MGGRKYEFYYKVPALSMKEYSVIWKSSCKRIWQIKGKLLEKMFKKIKVQLIG